MKKFFAFFILVVVALLTATPEAALAAKRSKRSVTVAKQSVKKPATKKAAAKKPAKRASAKKAPAKQAKKSAAPAPKKAQATKAVRAQIQGRNVRTRRGVAVVGEILIEDGQGNYLVEFKKSISNDGNVRVQGFTPGAVVPVGTTAWVTLLSEANKFTPRQGDQRQQATGRPAVKTAGRPARGSGGVARACAAISAAQRTSARRQSGTSDWDGFSWDVTPEGVVRFSYRPDLAAEKRPAVASVPALTAEQQDAAHTLAAGPAAEPPANASVPATTAGPIVADVTDVPAMNALGLAASLSGMVTGPAGLKADLVISDQLIFRSHDGHVWAVGDTVPAGTTGSLVRLHRVEVKPAA